MRRNRPVGERFAENCVKRDSGCWEWIGSPARAGYGRLKIGRRYEFAHRLSWRLHHGAIQDGLCVLHKCDNRICVNPDHLFVGTIQDNTDDMMRKGRDRPQIGSQKTQAKLIEAKVATIKARLERGESQSNLAIEFNVSRQTINHIAKGRRWTHV
jgi:hypothetical protein